jgi:hypothetical protein
MLFFPPCAQPVQRPKLDFAKDLIEPTSAAAQSANLRERCRSHRQFFQVVSKIEIKSTFVKTTSAAMELRQYPHGFFCCNAICAIDGQFDSPTPKNGCKITASSDWALVVAR